MREKLWFVAMASVAFVGCSSSSSNGGSTEDTGLGATDGTFEDTLTPPEDASNDAGDGAPDPLAGCTRDPGTPAPDGGAPLDDGGFASDAATDPIDPTAFTVDMAMAGFPTSSGTITALITTELGQIVCQLDDTNAPITTANFVGLARGTRPAQRTSSTWTWTHFYDGLKWHRVIPNFVIQGGDPRGNGTGGPGYGLPVENHVAEPKGTIAMAATGPTAPSGSQFYIVVGKGPTADYNVFGTCTTDVAIAIAGVPRNASDAPLTPVHMQTIEIARCP